MRTLAPADHDARRWEPKTLRLLLFSIPARLARHARRTHLRLPDHHLWTGLALTAPTRLQPG
ncbi:transposase [Nocardia miyunensis]|uniref:transposase n=1 Tax=Nocardia miyunensis TaxID=282684 RepID=UPI00082EBFB2